MNQLTTLGIVLARTNYGEADRIITVITQESGKLRLMAKGVRRVKSKLAGGIELFSVSDLTYIKGRGEIGTLVSSRLETHYGTIVKDIDRTMLGYELIKRLNKATEDEPEAEYYQLLQQAFIALDDNSIEPELIRLWFGAQLLRLAGHTPNLQTESDGTKLDADKTYDFNFDDVAFAGRPKGTYTSTDIKFLRLVFTGHQPTALAHVGGATELTAKIRPLVSFMQQQYIRE